MSKFSEGDKVVCVRQDFPWLPQYGGTGPAKNTPKKGEILFVDEVLGEFIRFDKYDTHESFNWWREDRFEKVNNAFNEFYNSIEHEAPVESIQG